MTSTTNNNDATDMEALYRCAIADASSLTQAETNLVFGWASPEEDERICRTKANGKTRAELIAIAATNPEQLTKVECQLVQRSKAFLADFRREEQNPNQPTPDLLGLLEVIDRGRDNLRAAINLRSIPLYKEAHKAVWDALDDRERLAIIAAKNRCVQILDEDRAEDDRIYELQKAQQAEHRASLGFSRD
ncbi:hypothetical protein QC763_0062450 [Podospora pseudopauciseta]|uniref:Uncharacterized protein n=1 Tax=Podospora pseudopauciseta TaxID=2093780 RepID=A0ABR0HBK4_9PEZI|nr:hypothetical protein QC763_0062450 [Podospora pseudopauciseta]